MNAYSSQNIAENPREEYRKFLRFPLSLHAKCHYNVGDNGKSCRIVDISMQGLGFELSTPVTMFKGQLVLLEIDIVPQQPPVSAITKLAWAQSREQGLMIQRAGSLVLFMDPQGKDRLLEHAYAVILSNIS